MAGKLFGLLLSGLSALFVSTVGTPVVWFILRVVGLTDLIILWQGHYYGLMVGGGLLIGTLIGGGLATLMAKMLERTRLMTSIASIIGGAIGGYVSSLMFFPIVVIL